MYLSFVRVTFVFVLLVSVYSGFAQDYYVVIGSFNTENTAARFANYARSQRYDPQILEVQKRQMYYVYVLKTTNRTEGIERTVQLQKESQFSDAWLYYRDDKSTTVVVEPPATVIGEEVFPEEQARMQTPPVEPATATEKETVPEVQHEPVEADPPAPVKPRGKFFIFQLSTPEGQPVTGNVYNVDRAQGRDLATYQANTRVDVLRPAVPGTPITIVCEIFGYREEVVVLDYADPGRTQGVEQNSEGVWIVPLTLSRLKKGDISVLYDVSFYKDAVIMTPRSQEELDELVSMMKSNPNYKIKIHGHTNGNERNLRIITPGSSKNYFGMNRTSSVSGSSKDLSRMRAEAIQTYLTDNGIAKNRIDTYAWGGTAMLAKTGTSAGARLNNRIEIEILDD